MCMQTSNELGGRVPSVRKYAPFEYLLTVLDEGEYADPRLEAARKELVARARLGRQRLLENSSGSQLGDTDTSCR